jgi:hypothetical protein
MLKLSILVLIRGVESMILVDTVDELRVLHRSLMVARFGKSQDDPVLMGSPILAGLHIEILDSLIDRDPKGSASEWAEWRKLSGPFADVIVDHLSTSKAFLTMSVSEQLKCVQICVSPFIASDDEIEALRIRCVEAGLQAGIAKQF